MMTPKYDQLHHFFLYISRIGTNLETYNLRAQTIEDIKLTNKMKEHY